MKAYYDEQEGPETVEERDEAVYQEAVDETLGDIDLALKAGRKKHGPITSRHEGYAVVLEELDEVKECVWHDRPSEELYKEITHAAAMLVRMATDLYLLAEIEHHQELELIAHGC